MAKIRVQFELPEELPAVQTLIKAAKGEDKTIHRLCKDICLRAYEATQPAILPPMIAPPLPSIKPDNNTSANDTKGMLGRAASLDDDGEF